MWERAKKIAAEMLDGKLWLPEVGKATHYHDLAALLLGDGRIVGVFIAAAPHALLGERRQGDQQ